MNQEPQITSHLLMVRPAQFGFNPQTAESNAFQSDKKGLSKNEIAQKAIAEFDEFVRRLQEVGIDVTVIEDTPTPVKTDAIFPNNWISFHADGKVITYPMQSPNRRLERRDDILALLRKRFDIQAHHRLETAEAQDKFLEGTGSMILDRPAKIIYACRSLRTHETLVKDFAKSLGYDCYLFDAIDGSGQAIYHTNVLMALGTSFVIICLDAFANEVEKNAILNSFAQTNKEVISISLEQMMAFAGNMLQVENQEGVSFLVMSQQAFKALSIDQVEQIKQHTQVLYSPLDTIETYGGGSARCMIAEIFLPEKVIQ